MSSDTSSKETRNGRLITFYSYKGGVGRSMALANIGVLLAQASASNGLSTRVLLVDWDLEAPGLERYFTDKMDVELSRQPDSALGVVDLIASRSKGRKLDWRECVVTAQLQGVSIDLITAGQQGSAKTTSESYAHRVQSLDWPDLFENADIGRYFDQLRNEWIAEYDFILVDSRTGITDIGDICTVILPDVLVPLFVTNRQNIDGVKKMIGRARKARQALPVDRTQLLVIPIPSRRENAEYDEYSRWENTIADELGGFFDDWLPINTRPLDAMRRLAIPYVPKWSFGERLPIIESSRELSDPSSIGAAFSRIASLIERNLDWSSEDWEVDSERTQLRANVLSQQTVIASSEEARREVELAAERAQLRFEAALRKKEHDLLYKSVAETTELTKKYEASKRRSRINMAGALAAFGFGAVLFGLYSSAENSKRVDAARSQLEALQVGLDAALSSLDQARQNLLDTQEADRVYDTGGAGVLMAKFSPDGSRIATALDDNTLRFWDSSTGSQLGEPLSGHEIVSAAFSPDGTQIVSGGSDGTLRLWDTLTGADIGNMGGNEGPVHSVTFSSDGTRIVSGGDDGTLRLWDAQTGDAIGAPMAGHEGSILSVAFSGDGKRIVSGGSDGTLRLWDAQTGAAIGAPMTGHEGSILSVAFSPDDSSIASGSADGTTRIWSTATGEILRLESASQKQAPVTDASFSPDGARIVTSLGDGTVRVWDALTGASISRISGFSDVVTSAEFSPDGRRILSASLDGTFRITRLSGSPP